MTPPREAGDALRILEATGALLFGHFRLSSGLHSDRYVQCARALEDPRDAERLGAAIGALFAAERVATVAAPALGGVVIGHEVARALGARFLFSERDGAAMVFRRGFALSPGERVLLVEDVLTTGGSVTELERLVREAGGTPVGIGAVVDRTGGSFEPGIPVRCLVPIDAPRYEPAACPDCARGVPVVKPGSRPG